MEPKLLEILWDGPFSANEIREKNNESDFGVYQVYGRHNISGPNTLVYIGKAEKGTFSERFRCSDRDWINYEYHEFEIYIGKLGSDKICTNKQWVLEIDTAERILIDYCLPSYNSQLNNLIEPLNKNIVLLNHGKRGSLPFTLTTLWRESSLSKGIWQAYSNKTSL